jgi:hypothetical protein
MGVSVRYIPYGSGYDDGMNTIFLLDFFSELAFSTVQL